MQPIVERLAALIPLAIAGLIFHVLMVPRPVAAPRAQPKTFSEMKKEYGVYFWIYILGVFPVWLAFSFLFFMLFKLWQDVYVELLPDGIIKLVSWPPLMLPSLFLGLTACFLFWEIVLRRFFAGRYDEFKAYTRYRHWVVRFPKKYADYRDGKLPIPVSVSSGLSRLVTRFVWVAVIFLLLIVYLVLRYYIIVDATGITLSRFVVPVPERHAFSDIAKIASVSNSYGGRSRKYNTYRNSYEIAFSNHQSLTTDWTFTGDEAAVRAFVELLSERSGVPIAGDPYTGWMSAADFKSKFEAMREQRYFPERIEGRMERGHREFRGKFMPYHFGPSGFERYGQFRYQSVWGKDSDAFADEDREMTRRGFRRLSVQKFDDGADAAFQATWVKDDW
jgi:Bacterial tandem repeat domain 1